MLYGTVIGYKRMRNLEGHCKLHQDPNTVSKPLWCRSISKASGRFFVFRAHVFDPGPYCPSGNILTVCSIPICHNMLIGRKGNISDSFGLGI